MKVRYNYFSATAQTISGHLKSRVDLNARSVSSNKMTLNAASLLGYGQNSSI